MFSTRNMALAAFIIAAKKLRFTHIEAHTSFPADICFDDPGNVGKQLEIAFINGDDPVPSARLYQSKSRPRISGYGSERNLSSRTTID